MSNKILNVKKLSVIYSFGRTSFKAVNKIDIDIKKGEIVGLIGESGSGKTSTAKAILGQIPFHADEVSISEIDIPNLPSSKKKKMKKQIATTMQMIYQSPSASLNPTKRVWKIVAEGMQNVKLSKEETRINVDNKQKELVTKIFDFSKKLKDKSLTKEIDIYKKLLKEIEELNKKVLSIDKNKTKVLLHPDLIRLESYYNDKLDVIVQTINMNNANLELTINSHKKLLKKKYKSMFVTKETEAKIEINKLKKNKKGNNEIKKAKEKLNLELKNINIELNEKLESLKNEGSKLKEITKEKNNNLKQRYDERLNEYDLKRKKMIKKLFNDSERKILSEKINSLNKEIENKYISIRAQDEKIRAMLEEISIRQNKEKEYIKHKEKYDDILKEYLKYKNRPFGSKKQIKERALQLLETVGLPRKIGFSFTPQLSGGQQQRVAIARAFSMNPKFIIADEPIASLDVSLQGSIVNLIKKLAKDNGTAVLFITHDLEMVRRIANRMLVMNRGNIVEKGSTKKIFEKPVHPYTKMLMSSSQTIDEAMQKVQIYKYTPDSHIYSKTKAEMKEISKDHFIMANEKELKEWKKNA